MDQTGSNLMQPNHDMTKWFDIRGKGLTFKAKRLGDHILNSNRFIYANGQIYIYQDGLYLPNGIDAISAQAVHLLGDEFKDSRILETIAYIKRVLRQNQVSLNQNTDLVNLRNGNLLWKNDPPILKEFSPEVYTSIRIPVNFNVAATCPLIEKFLYEILPSDCIPLIYELIGLLLIPDTRFEKAFLFLGSGANGKSTLLKLIQRFIGIDNIASESLQNLSDNRFRGAELKDKLANICPDLPDRALKDTSFFKALVSGEAISVEQKFSQPFQLVNTARLVFSANTLPASADLTDGFYRRWIIIRFPNTFPSGTSDPNLIEKLTSEMELSGLLNKALEGLKRLYHNKQFTVSTSVVQHIDIGLKSKLNLLE
jgi:putative DNA primase/helicase